MRVSHGHLKRFQNSLVLLVLLILLILLILLVLSLRRPFPPFEWFVVTVMIHSNDIALVQS